MTEYNKPVPPVNDEAGPYWAALKRHELHIQRCSGCGQYYFYPRDYCPYCLSSEVAWTKVSGRGQLYSFTVMNRPISAAFAADVPYNVAIVELDEGPRMMTSIVDCNNDDLAIGMPLEVVYDDITDAVTLPRFKPVETALNGNRLEKRD